MTGWTSPHTPDCALTEAVRARQGVARTVTLIRAGHSRSRIAGALDAGMLVRVRRGWVALPGAEPELVAAARDAVVLTCVTAARRLGLWVLAEDRCHVAADPHRGGPAPEAVTVHWARPVVPRHTDALVDPVENVLVAVASCQPHEAALTVWDSAVRQGLVTKAELARLPLGPAGRAVLAAVEEFTDSGIETLFRVRLRWLRVRILHQIWLAGHRADFLIGERLVVQADGGHHVGAQRAEDLAHDAELMLRGYHVLRFTYAQIVGDWPAVQSAIMRALAQRLHLA
ncbi:endonuclease domain-containing protein [Microbacterium lacticum]